MLGDWLQPLELPISFADFERLPRNAAYKYEYVGSRAVLAPRPRYQRAILDLNGLRPPNSGSSPLAAATLRLLEAGDWTCLPELLAAAFRSVPPLGSLAADVRCDVARACIEYTASGGDGPLVHPACFVAVQPRDAERLAAAIVVTLTGERPHLTWVLVQPWCFARGLGSALLACAVRALRELGYRDLASTFLVGNDRATLWHWRRGFRLTPGLPRG